MWETVAQAVINGLLIGGIYALVSIGVTLIFGVVKIVNFAQGEFVMIGMYISFFLANQFGIDPLLSLVVSMPVPFVASSLLRLFTLSMIGAAIGYTLGVGNIWLVILGIGAAQMLLADSALRELMAQR